MVLLALHPPIHTDSAEPGAGKKDTMLEPAIADKADKATLEIAPIAYSTSKLNSCRSVNEPSAFRVPLREMKRTGGSGKWEVGSPKYKKIGF